MAVVNIDFSKKVRPMKPMHGVDNGPWTCNFTRDARPLFKEAGIPFSRLHDTEYPFGSGEFVDIPCIFKNFDADVNDPSSYNFALTDLYLQAIVECNTKIIYRLGVSIEHNPVKRHIFPPKDYLKWAKICEHIIMHYNEGWADGYHMGIERWEIWNEPNHSKDRKMWGGTAEDFAELYSTAASYLKEKFPHLKIGGPAFSNPESEFVYDFFNKLTENGNHPPMDFYSWHGYVDTIEKAVERANNAQKVMDMYGYGDAESIFDEWNYVKSWHDMGYNYDIIQNQKGAAFDAALMAALQNTTCDICCYYDAQMKFAGSWCGLFKLTDDGRTNGGENFVSPKKPFFAFKAFNEVYKCGQQVDLQCNDERIYAVASSNDTTSALMISSFADPQEGLEDKNVEVNIKGLKGKTASVYLLDDNHNLEKIISFEAASFTISCLKYSVILVKFE